ncbi:hypothetical protein [Amycolatopsis sp. CA-230715]|uniref:hypothetical protein n=1 Tax=Amycolatopsis sp. CA-230715 TaxID=2745196 RepID=UPI001C01400E|nr:hypothetical protein [Amycolatopsis sp. CA-230715]QWF79649.1 hypothetical protein HUW46_03058 [Amycolatopsis sp. CA-230715]
MTDPQVPPPPPADGEPGTAPSPVVSPRQLVVAVLAALAAVVAVAGSFLTLFSGGFASSFGGRGFSLSITGWAIELGGSAASRSAGGLGPVAPIGYPLVLAAILLLFAAVLVLRSRAPEPKSVPVGKILVVAGAAFLTGTAVTVAMQGIGWSGLLGAAGVAITPDVGFWLVAVGVVASIAAAVLAFLPERVEPAGPEPEVVVHDVSTPRHGVPVVDPLTGEPKPADDDTQWRPPSPPA